MGESCGRSSMLDMTSYSPLGPRGAPWSETPIAVMKEQSTDPDNSSIASQDRSDLGNQRMALVPVLQLPVLHMEGQTSAVILMVTTTFPGTHGTHSHRRTDWRLMWGEPTVPTHDSPKDKCCCSDIGPWWWWSFWSPASSCALRCAWCCIARPKAASVWGEATLRGSWDYSGARHSPPDRPTTSTHGGATSPWSEGRTTLYTAPGRSTGRCWRVHSTATTEAWAWDV